ncbi:MAG: hypothetical protein HY459_03285 [Parcubacteria group bacterium]|nr:hypothetical protein [Parcubacteria group bacterium]
MEIAIPKIIHQIYHPFPPRTEETIPYNRFKRAWIESWKRCHPDWEYRLWGEEDSRELIKAYYPWFLSTYDSYDVPIKRVDAIKYFVLHAFGGLYVDLDFACLKNFEPLLGGLALAFGYQTDEEESRLFRTSAIGNALIGSAKGHPFWEEVFPLLIRHKHEAVFEATGPVLLTKIVRSYQEGHRDIAVFGKRYLYPFQWNDEQKQKYASLSLAEARRLFPDAYAITFWTQSFIEH